MDTSNKNPLRHELKLDSEVRRLMLENRGLWRSLAQASGVSHSWMSKFSRGEITNPGYSTLKRLHRLMTMRRAGPPPAAPVLPPVSTTPGATP